MAENRIPASKCIHNLHLTYLLLVNKYNLRESFKEHYCYK